MHNTTGEEDPWDQNNFDIIKIQYINGGGGGSDRGIVVVVVWPRPRF